MKIKYLKECFDYPITSVIHIYCLFIFIAMNSPTSTLQSGHFVKIYFFASILSIHALQNCACLHGNITTGVM